MIDNLKLHLRYVVIIFMIVSLGLLSLVFVPSKTAIGTLSYAATLLSIVLAVIAILITLWDVAGQKDSLLEVKQQTKELKETVDELKIMHANADNIVDSIKNLQVFLVSELKNTQNLANDIMAGLNDLKNTSSQENIVEKITNFEEQIKKNYNDQQQLSKNFQEINLRHYKNEILEVIREYFSDRVFTSDELKQTLYSLNRSKFEVIMVDGFLDELYLLGMISKNENDDEIKYFYR